MSINSRRITPKHLCKLNKLINRNDHLKIKIIYPQKIINKKQ